MEIIIKCDKCPKAYRVRVDMVHKIYPESLRCTGCGNVLSLDPFVLDEEELRYFSSGEALKEEIASNLKKLYPMPHVLFKARSLLTDYGNFEELEKILSTDPALAGRVLKVANSAYYGMSGKVSSIQMAATVLGGDTLLQIITLISNSKMLGRSLVGYGLNAGDLWRHSLSVATCAKLIEDAIYPNDGEDAFFAGLMHDSGKIILDAYILERRHIFKRYIDLTHVSMTAAEKKILEFDHADIGYELCRRWNLPEMTTAAIKYHHTPAASGGNRLAYIINLADHMATVIAASPKKLPKPPTEALQFLPITEIGLKDLTRKAEEAIESLEEITY
jgi:putative nucleotidyltransferase with HDIG domain